MLRRWAARKSAGKFGRDSRLGPAGLHCLPSRAAIVATVKVIGLGADPVESVDEVLLCPMWAIHWLPPFVSSPAMAYRLKFCSQLGDGAQHVGLHSPDIQLQNIRNLVETAILKMPEGEHRSLTRREPVERGGEPLLNLPRENLLFRIRPAFRSHRENCTLVLCAGSLPPELPFARPQAVETGVNRDTGNPFAGLVDGWAFGAL